MDHCDWCNLSDEDKKFQVYESKSWSVFLSDEQDYIGRCILVLKRHCGSLSELTDEEWEDMEEERRQEEIRKNIYNENGEALRRQMREKAEKKRVLERGVMEEGRQIKQEQDDYRRTLERIKKEKLDEMERYHIDPKYRVDLQKYKIH